MHEKHYLLMQKHMYKIVFSAQARSEYLSIWQYIAKDNLFYANEVLNKIDYSVNILKTFPRIGKSLEDELMEIVEPRYWFRIIYEVVDDEIMILSIFRYKNHWKQDFQ